MQYIFSLFLLATMWVQVPQWNDDWSKCAVDVPDVSLVIGTLFLLIIHLEKDLIGKMLHG